MKEMIKMDINKKIENMEKEMDHLKSVVINMAHSAGNKKPVALSGMLKGINVSDEDIEESEKSLFKSGA